MKEMLSVIRMDLAEAAQRRGGDVPAAHHRVLLSATLSVSAAVFLYVIVVYFFVYTPAAYDEQSKGDYLTGSLPVRREKLVAAKYLYDLAVVAGACLAALAAGGIGAALKLGRGGSVTGMLPVLILIGCAFTAFVQPLILGFGVTRARYWILAAYAFGVAGGDRARHERGRNARADAFGAARLARPAADPVRRGAARGFLSHRAAALRPPPVHRLRRPAMRNVLLLCRTDWFRLAGLPRYSLVYLLILAGFSVSTHVAPIGYIMACYVLSATVVGFDDNSAAGLFTGTLPVSRAQIVWGKYFFCTAFLLLADGVVLLVNRAAAGCCRPPSIRCRSARCSPSSSAAPRSSSRYRCRSSCCSARSGRATGWSRSTWRSFSSSSGTPRRRGAGGFRRCRPMRFPCSGWSGRRPLPASALITVCLYREHEYLQ